MTAGTDEQILATGGARCPTDIMTTPRTTYVFDAYSPRCHGFSAAIAGFVADRPESTIDVVHGTLYAQQHVQPIRRLATFSDDCAQVAAETGAAFGARHRELVERGVFIMDSGAAAIGFAALRALAPHRGVELAIATQAAFFRDGLSLSDAGTYRRIAEDHGLDTACLNELLADRSTRRNARIDAVRCADLGVTEYPALIVHGHRGDVRIGTWTSSAADLGAAFAAVAAG